MKNLLELVLPLVILAILFASGIMSWWNTRQQVKWHREFIERIVKLGLDKPKEEEPTE